MQSLKKQPFLEMKNPKLTIFFLIIQTLSFAQIRLPKLISDGMVLQRDKPLKIWGWSSPKEIVNLSFQNKTYKSTANEAGKWEIILPAQKTGGPHEMTFKGSNELKIKDILFGDVWFCSGQSNMVHQMAIHNITYAKDIADATNSNIRHFWIPTATNLNRPAEDFSANASWKVCSPENVLPFSAVAYFFAKKMYEKYQIPIGLINASVGGTPIEAWTSEEGFKDFAKIQETIQKNKDTTYINSFKRVGGFTPPQMQDKGLIGDKKWFDISYTPKGWKSINVPGYWEDQGIKELNGVVWYRKEIDVPASMIGKTTRVFLGRIVDADVLYINGKQVGATTYMYPQRRYNVPADLLKAGKNIFVVKVTNNGGKGGFVPDKPYCLFAEKDTIDLKGTWQYKVGEVFIPRNDGSFGGGFSAQNAPTSLYNAMVAPVINYGIKGILWYQGESNSGKGEEYAKLQPAQIADWRNKFNQGELPFLYVQLPNFMDANYIPSESQWAELREAQLKSLSVPNTAMVVGIDLGEWNDIHPDNKKSVGERLALAAQKLVYNENVVGSGPIFQSASIEGNKIVLSFTQIGSGLIANDDEELREFAIAGVDKKFVWATAKIVGNKIEVSNKNIASPMYVRYAWADNPNVNFYNKEGLPASPFRTDEDNSDKSKVWQGKKAAVVLTYDDAINQHLDNALPVLNELNLRATFYITAFSEASKNRIKEWRNVANQGHELGNHTLYHPCVGGVGRTWLNKERDMNNYSVQRMIDEARMTNVFLEALDGKKKRTFAFTCGDMKVAGSNFIDSLKNDFVAARAVRAEMHSIDKVNLYDVDCYMVNNNTAEQMMAWVDKAIESHSLLVILFHGVGGGNSLDVKLPEHRKFLEYLKKHENELMIAPMLEVAEHIKIMQK